MLTPSYLFNRQMTRCRRPPWRRSASWWTTTIKSLAAPARERVIWLTLMAPYSCTELSAFLPLILLGSSSCKNDPNSKYKLLFNLCVCTSYLHNCCAAVQKRNICHNNNIDDVPFVLPLSESS